MVTDRIEREIVIAAPPERVWDVVTQAEHLGSWFADRGAEIDLRPGGALALHWRDHGTSHGRVEDVKPPSSFSFRWVITTGEQPAEGNTTLVVFTLAPEGDGTRLRVAETGFASLNVSAEQQAKHVEENSHGWSAELEELREYAEARAA
jgi:uncharacterized protein YndB with AHSA1/START domain